MELLEFFDRAETTLLVKTDAETTTNPRACDKRLKNIGRKADAPTINTVSQYRTCTAAVDTQILILGDIQIHNDLFSFGEVKFGNLCHFYFKTQQIALRRLILNNRY